LHHFLHLSTFRCHRERFAVRRADLHVQNRQTHGQQQRQGQEQYQPGAAHHEIAVSIPTPAFSLARGPSGEAGKGEAIDSMPQHGEQGRQQNHGSEHCRNDRNAPCQPHVLEKPLR
jgi:hypothetical protein